jgi:hypothetical protein
LPHFVSSILAFIALSYVTLPFITFTSPNFTHSFLFGIKNLQSLHIFLLCTNDVRPYENKLVKAKTDGKPARNVPRLSLKNDITVLDPERDHPRLLSGSQQLMRGYGANYDFQLLLAPLNDIPDQSFDEEVTTISEWAQKYLESFNNLDLESKNNLKEIYNNRKYFNKDEYTRAVIHYVAGYCCKGEKSPKDAVKMLQSIVFNDNINGNSSYQSIAYRFTSKLLSSRIILSSECDFLLSGLSNYRSTFTFQNSPLALNNRIINKQFSEQVVQINNNNENANNDNNETNENSSLKKNIWDKFLIAVNNTNNNNPPQCYYDFIISEGFGSNVIPVLSYGTLNPKWPLDEEFCRSVLTLFKSDIKKISDIKNEFSTYKEALENYLLDESNNIPDGIIRKIKRVVIASVKFQSKIKNNPNNNNNNNNNNVDRGNGVDDNYEMSIDSNEEIDSNNEDEIDNIYNLDNNNNNNDNDNFSDFGLLNDNDFSECEIGYLELNIQRNHWPNFDEMFKWLTNVIKIKETVISNNDDIFHLPMESYLDGSRKFYDPMKSIKNEGQKILIYSFIESLKCLLNWYENPIGNKPILRAIVIGEAGTGKTFCMKLMQTITCIFTSLMDSVLITAPAGVAACACGGVVPDKKLDFKRNSSTFKSLDHEQLIKLQNEFRNVKLIMRDEMSMEGHNLQGLFANRCRETMNDGEQNIDLLGGIDISLNLGDFMQLPPVKDTPCYLTVTKKANPVETLGYNIYYYLNLY